MSIRRPEEKRSGSSGMLRKPTLLPCFVALACAGCFAPAQPTPLEFRGSIKAGQAFERSFGENYYFILEPQEFGWNLIIREKGRDDRLQRLTPPLHFVPNPTWIEGWHFRNDDNTKPNDGTVNAPQYEREFIFSPAVGRSIQGPDATVSPTPEEIERVRSFGRGVVQISDLELSPPRRGERAKILKMTFRCVITMKNRE